LRKFEKCAGRPERVLTIRSGSLFPARGIIAIPGRRRAPHWRATPAVPAQRNVHPWA
jgi:hypothetical protein